MKRKNVFARIAALLLTAGFAWIPVSAGASKLSVEQTGTMTAECAVTFPEKLSGKEYRVTDGLVES